MNAVRAEYRIMRMLVTRKWGNFVVPNPYTKKTVANEQQLHCDCTQFMEALGWKRVAHEWDVVHGFTQYGRGDMVFAKGPWALVVEAKRRRSPKVYEQARFYAAAWKLQRATDWTSVAYGVWTPQSQELLGIVKDKRTAADICWARFRI